MLRNKRSPLRAILFGGSIAGAIDIGAASLINATSVSVILKAVASGVLGSASFHGGAKAAWLGLALQWLMSLWWDNRPHLTPRHFAEDMLAMLLFGLIIAFFARNLSQAHARTPRR